MEITVEVVAHRITAADMAIRVEGHRQEVTAKIPTPTVRAMASSLTGNRLAGHKGDGVVEEVEVVELPTPAMEEDKTSILNHPHRITVRALPITNLLVATHQVGLPVGLELPTWTGADVEAALVTKAKVEGVVS